LLVVQAGQVVAAAVILVAVVVLAFLDKVLAAAMVMHQHTRPAAAVALQVRALAVRQFKWVTVVLHIHRTLLALLLTILVVVVAAVMLQRALAVQMLVAAAQMLEQAVLHLLILVVVVVALVMPTLQLVMVETAVLVL
jgi:hypothetical protein